MASNKPKSKKQTRTMPHASLAPLSTRKRRKKIRTRVTAAVSIDEDLYTQALRKAAVTSDNNFSGYVRKLIRSDINHAA